MLDSVIAALTDDLDVVLLDVGRDPRRGGAAGTAVAELHARPRAGVAETLDVLAGTMRLAAVTNTAVMREPDVRRLLDAAGLHHLDVVVTSVDAGAAKPDPTALRLALERLDATADRALYIGDLDTDQGRGARRGHRLRRDRPGCRRRPRTRRGVRAGRHRARPAGCSPSMPPPRRTPGPARTS